MKAKIMCYSTYLSSMLCVVGLAFVIHRVKKFIFSTNKKPVKILSLDHFDTDSHMSDYGIFSVHISALNYCTLSKLVDKFAIFCVFSQDKNLFEMLFANFSFQRLYLYSFQS